MSVSLANTTLLQLLPGGDEAPLGSGTLGLAATGDAEAPLLLQLNALRFPVARGAQFGTDAADPLLYSFLFAPAGSSSEQFWVRIRLAPGTATEHFEELLIQHGFLLDGIRAAGDEIARSAVEGGQKVAQSVRETRDASLAQQPGEPLQISSETQTSLDNASASTQTAREWTGAVTGKIGEATQAVGAQAGKGWRAVVGESEPQEEGETKKALREAASGVSEGASHISSSIAASTGPLLSHNLGDDAKQAAASAGQTLANAGMATENALLGTSGIYHGLQASQGAREGAAEQSEAQKRAAEQ